MEDSSKKEERDIFHDVPKDDGSHYLPGILIERIEGEKYFISTKSYNDLCPETGLAKRYEYDGPPTSLAQVLLA